MKLFPIQKIHPLLLEPKQFKDRFGQPNAYLDMNPSLFIDPSGNATVLIRRVNYRKFPDKSFTLYEPQAKSEYLILKGHITNPFCTFFVQPLVAHLPQTYFTYWRGVEDIRFINETTVLATIPECHPKGQPALFQGRLIGNRVSDLQLLAPNDQPEKNWMPFGDNQVVYSVDPASEGDNGCLFKSSGFKSPVCRGLKGLSRFDERHSLESGLAFPHSCQQGAHRASLALA